MTPCCDGKKDIKRKVTDVVVVALPPPLSLSRSPPLPLPLSLSPSLSLPPPPLSLPLHHEEKTHPPPPLSRLHPLDRPRADPRHRRLRAVDLHVQPRPPPERPHRPEPRLVVGPAAADEHLHLRLLDRVGGPLERADDALERRGDVGEVGDAAADDQRALLAVAGAGRGDREDLLGVLVRLGLVGRARVLGVVSELLPEREFFFFFFF